MHSPKPSKVHLENIKSKNAQDQLSSDLQSGTQPFNAQSYSNSRDIDFESLGQRQITAELEKLDGELTEKKFQGLDEY